MTLTDRIALAEKLGYRSELHGLIDAKYNKVDLVACVLSHAYRVGYMDGRDILRVEGA